jgi:hypothetical protein
MHEMVTYNARIGNATNHTARMDNDIFRQVMIYKFASIYESSVIQE